MSANVRIERERKLLAMIEARDLKISRLESRLRTEKEIVAELRNALVEASK